MGVADLSCDKATKSNHKEVIDMKKFVSLFLVVVLCLLTVPMQAFALESDLHAEEHTQEEDAVIRRLLSMRPILTAMYPLAVMGTKCNINTAAYAQVAIRLHRCILMGLLRRTLRQVSMQPNAMGHGKRTTIIAARAEVMKQLGK